MMNELKIITIVILFLAFAAGLVLGAFYFISPLADSEEAPGYATSPAPNARQFCFAYGCGVARILFCHGRAMGTAGDGAYGFYFNEDDSHTTPGNG